MFIGRPRFGPHSSVRELDSETDILCIQSEERVFPGSMRSSSRLFTEAPERTVGQDNHETPGRSLADPLTRRSYDRNALSDRLGLPGRSQPSDPPHRKF